MRFFWRNLLPVILIAVILSNCSSFSERLQEDTKLLIEYALYDFPFPPSSQIVEKETVILGSGDRWSGKVRYLDKKSPAELLKFYDQVVMTAGWEMKSSTVSEGIVLVFSRENRVATVEINRLSFLEGLKIAASRATSVTVSLNYVDTIGDKELPQSPTLRNLENLRERN
tara:strand:+ start:85 stop:594 length:510 start_codon:yes stop_codon:yes gene_type:complete